MAETHIIQDSLIVDGTLFIQIPVGTTGERPGTAAEGMMRLNTTLGYIEVYKNAAWGPIDARQQLQIESGDTRVVTDDTGGSENVSVQVNGVEYLKVQNPGSANAAVLLQGTSATIVPVGTTAQRPSSAANGMIRFNSSTSVFEGWNGTEWVQLDAAGMFWSATTTNVTAQVDEGIMCDTTGGAITVTLPASPAVGDKVGVLDAVGNAATNNITVDGGAADIMGLAEDFIIDLDRSGAVFVYHSVAQGWVIANSVGEQGMLDTKADKVGSPTANGVAGLDAGGNLIDGGILLANVLQAGVTKNLSVGITTDVEALGTTTTITPNLANEGLKSATVNGNLTVNEPADGTYGACLILLTISGGPWTVTAGAGVTDVGGPTTLNAGSTYELRVVKHSDTETSAIFTEIV